MRVNPNFTADILQDLYKSQGQEQTTIEQMATGRLINMPSDNPAGAAALVEGKALQSQNDQFLANTSSVEGLLQTADSTLSSVVTAVNRAISLGVQGGSGALSDADRQAIAQQVQGIQSQILQLGNVSYQGNYIFAGTATKTTPFTLDSAAADGVTYNGNDNTNSVQIAEGQSIQINLPGDQVFQGGGGDVFGALQQLVTALQSNDSNGIGAATTQLGGALNYLSQQRVFYGNAVNQLTSNQSFLQQEKVNLQSQENAIDGVDMAKAATDMSQAQVTQSAALAALARVLPLSLMDYLK
jgi:flagellar hook-associated protein 3 FlgL